MSNRLSAPSEPALIAEALHFTYPPPGLNLPEVPVLQGLDLNLAEGQSLAVLGAGESGKSTLCHILAGLTPRYTGGRLEGRLHVAGLDPLTAALPPDRIGLLFQDAATQLFTTSAEDEVAWGLEALAVPPAEIGPRVTEALERFALLPLRRRPPWALSGGQQKRLALAALWALRPRILLLDEPLEGLDPPGQAGLREALHILQEDGTTLLLTAPHPRIATLTDTAALLEAGRLTLPESASALRAQETRLVDAGLLYPSSRWPDLEPQPTAADAPALVLEGVRFAYPQGPEVLHALELEIPAGQFVVVVGPNGAGKSTLIRHFNGLLRPTAGAIRLFGRPTQGCSIGELARSVGFLFQRPEQQIFSATVREEIAYGLQQLRLPDAPARIARALNRFGLEPVADRPPAVLSQSTRRATVLAALAALETPILVLDEPTGGLDGRGWAQLLEWLAERRAAGATLIIVTHEMELAARADRVLFLDGGRLVADAPPARVLPRLPWEVIG